MGSMVDDEISDVMYEFSSSVDVTDASLVDSTVEILTVSTDELLVCVVPDEL